MRISGFVVLVVCLLCTATAASAASSAVGACSCIGAEQGIPMHTGYWGIERNIPAPAQRTACSLDLLSSDVRPTKRRKRRVIGMAGARSFSSRRCNTGRIRRNIPASCAKRTAGSVDLLSIDVRHIGKRRRRGMRTAAARLFSIQPIDVRRTRKRKRRAMRVAAARSFSIRLIDGSRTRKRRRRAMRTPAARSFSIPPAARRGCSAAAVRASRRSGVPFAIFGSCRTGTGFRAPHRPPAWPYCGVRVMSPSSGSTTATAPQCSMTPTAARGSPACIVSA